MFFEKLKALRMAAGLSQPELAKRSGISVGTIRNMEQGLRQPSWETVQKLAAAMQIPFDSFADDRLKKAVDAPKAKKKK
jgi:transcriptional regulator with XRE-family HTH domain